MLELLQWCEIHAEHPGLCRVLRSFLLLREHHTPTCFLLHSQFAPCLHMFEMSPPVMLSRPSPAQLTEEDAGDRCHTAAYLAEHMWDTHSALLLSICTRTRAWKKESTNMRTLSGAVCAYVIMCECACARMPGTWAHVHTHVVACSLKVCSLERQKMTELLPGQLQHQIVLFRSLQVRRLGGPLQRRCLRINLDCWSPSHSNCGLECLAAPV